MIRKPVVAGRFYTANPSLLAKEVSGLVGQKKEKIDAIGVVSPHAGYMYSGGVAGEVLSSIKPKAVGAITSVKQRFTNCGFQLKNNF